MRFPVATSLVFLATLASFVRVTHADYVIIFDAGSTKTKAHVFAWSHPNQPRTVPIISELGSKKSEPGISKLSTREKVVEKMNPLIEYCKSQVPESDRSKTPMYLKATAGMRLLSVKQAEKIMDLVQGVLSNSGFQFKSARIISGGEEGSFGWLTANYLLGSFNVTPGEERKPSVGALDLGGASSQITFEPDVDILSGYFPIFLGLTPQIRYDLYSRSFLRFGQDEARKRLYEHTIDDRDLSTASAPCWFSDSQHNFTDTRDDYDMVYNFIGTGNFAECRRILNDLTFRNTTPCFYPKCSINGKYTPPIPANLEFVAVSSYYYAAQGIGFKSGSLADFIETATKYCAIPWEDIKKRPGFSEHTINNCYGAALAITYLVDSYGFNESLDDQVRFEKDIEKIDAGWPLGAALYELNVIEIGLGHEIKPPCGSAGGLSGAAVGVISALAVLLSIA